VAEGSDETEGTAQRQRTVVVIDDDDVVLTSTAEILKQAGYRVLTRNRPAGCVAMILQEKPDLVLLDVCMPTVSGDTLVKLFARAAPNSKTIVLLYSALDEPLLRSKAKSAGAHGYVAKASGPAGLLRALKYWFKDASSQHRLPRILTPLNPSSGAMPSVSSTRRRVDFADSLPATSRLDMPPRVAPRQLSGTFALDGPTVLFVDDDMLILSAYRRQLQGQPFQFEFALSGSQALRLLTSESPPNAVVSDLRMPSPDGYEVLHRALDLDASWAHRFVIVTGQARSDVKRQLDPRFSGPLLHKPVETDALTSAILKALGIETAAPSSQRARTS